ncbi:MAG: hypothetical protein LGL72_04225 [Acidibrevibacterium sp.]|jgi:hypothetical protein|uniref:hypothetical protein n=1 Tax=Acidibrevibacterium fodinaquatile TaxID=1969806 RepID=UPI000E0D1E57|nr:hypothetical protein [Acidibrevibacterium fodinaquatile]MCA7118609.1 hypothetical protein [Acidibrevibacterium fodinaquatile]
MIAPKISHLADMMIEKFGNEASGHAMQRALEMHKSGDADGESLWLKIFEKIREIQDDSNNIKIN